MEKLSSVLTPSSRFKLTPAVLALLSTVAAACTKTVYVPTYQNLPEDTGYSRSDEPDVEVPSEEDLQKDSDEGEPSSLDSGTPEYPLSADECGEVFDPVDMTIFDESLFVIASMADFSLNPVLTVRYEDFYGRALPAEGFYPLVRLVYKNSSESFNTAYCYPFNTALVDGSAFVVSYDLTCGLDTSLWEYGKAFAYLLMADEAAPCESRPFAATGDWLFENGAFIEDPCFVGIDTCH